MATSIVDADTVLALDVGTVTTRAMLFDTVAGSYRFLAQGIASTTAGPPLFDVGLGVRRAITRLQSVTGRELLGVNERLVIPTSLDGTGVDTVVATLSTGQPLTAVAVGLLEDVSLESARHLATTTYARVVDMISMNDRRKMEARIDAVLRHQPDLIVIAGGTDHGASKSVFKLLDAVGLSCLLMPEKQRPYILYAGNETISDEVSNLLKGIASVQIAPNIRPSLEDEELGPADAHLRHIFREFHTHDNHGMHELDEWAERRLMPSAQGFGRVIRFLSRVYDPQKGVLGVDLGASSTTMAAAFEGNLKRKVYLRFGMGAPLQSLLKFTTVERVSNWLSFKISQGAVRDYVYNKAVHPASVPVTEQDLEIEQALAREILRITLRDARRLFPPQSARIRPGLLPSFEPIIASGSVLTQAPNRGQSLLMILDGLEPVGITTVVLDQNNLVPVLGAIAEINPILAVQVLESGALLNLGTVIAPVGNARPGTPVLRVRMPSESGKDQKWTVKYGSLVTIPLAAGQTARLHLQPYHRFDVGLGGPGKGGRLRVVGGALGVVIDARGRPLQLAKDPARRRERIKKWRWYLGS